MTTIALGKKHGTHFSLAHSSGMIALALARGKIGVDCEPDRQSRNWLGIADTFFTQEESEAMRAAPPPEQAALFLRYWVAKESHIKAIRGSIFGGLNKLSLGRSGTATLPPASIDQQQPWWLWLGKFGGNHLAICCALESKPEICFTIDERETNPVPGHSLEAPFGAIRKIQPR